MRLTPQVTANLGPSISNNLNYMPASPPTNNNHRQVYNNNSRGFSVSHNPSDNQRLNQRQHQPPVPANLDNMMARINIEEAAEQGAVGGVRLLGE